MCYLRLKRILAQTSDSVTNARLGQKPGAVTKVTENLLEENIWNYREHKRHQTFGFGIVLRLIILITIRFINCTFTSINTDKKNIV